jgi:hypothetical protein
MRDQKETIMNFANSGAIPNDGMNAAIKALASIFPKGFHVALLVSPHLDDPRVTAEGALPISVAHNCTEEIFEALINSINNNKMISSDFLRDFKPN